MDTRKDGRDHDLHSEHVKNPEVTYDRTDLSARGIAMFLIALAVAGIITHFVLWGAYRFLAKGDVEPTQPNAMVTSNKELQQVGGDPSQVFPEPRLQPNPPADMQKFRASELQHLYSYGKGEGGALYIPIDKAMDTLAQQGLPTRPQQAAPQGGQSMQPQNPPHASSETGAGKGPSGYEPQGKK
jgi:hypothetical protein